MPDKVFYRVDILESESGWGSRVDESIYYTTKAKAEKYVADYNKKYNTAAQTPSWYMVALAPVADILTPEQVKRIRKEKSERRYFSKK